MATRRTDIERLDLALDGAPGDEERAASLAESSAAPLAAERRRLERLHDHLVAARVAARPGFAAEVMAALPAEPAWATRAGAARALGGWRAAVAALVVLAVAASALLGLGSERVAGSVPALGALAAIAEFATAAVLSGAGLLSASWRGIGSALGEALDVPARVVFGLGVIGLNALLFVLLRRRRRQRSAATATARRRS